MTIKDFDQKLAALAKLAVRVGINIKPGQQFIINAPVEAVAFARLLTAEAYKAGASLVTTLFYDEETQLLRLKNADPATFDTAADWLYKGQAEALGQGAARLYVVGENPGLLAGQNPEHLARIDGARARAAKPMMQYATDFAINWSIVPYATLPWAKTMFPNDADEAAMDKLWQAIFQTCRVEGPDPLAAWQVHLAGLNKRAAWLNAKRYKALHFRAPGTDLTVGLAANHKWESAGGTAKNGVACVCNLPTEEVFTTPDWRMTEGTARSTKPLAHNGTLIEDIRVVFKGGRIVEATAAKGQQVLRDLLATDIGAAQLGEVALVPHASAISQSGLLFYETLFDENAACHIAIGEAYTTCFDKTYSRDELNARGANESLVHVDWMIGCGEMDIDGITQDGKAEPLFRKGEWAA